MTQREMQPLLEKYGWAVSKLITRSMGIVSKSYNQMVMMDLLMALPVKPQLKEIDISKMTLPDGSPVIFENIAVGGYITRDRDANMPNRLTVHLVFTKDINMTWDEYFNKMTAYGEDYLQNEVAFTYLHEAMHILMRHYDFYINQTYFQIIQEFRPEFTKEQMGELLNHAFDYWINGYLIEQSNTNTIMNSLGNNPKFLSLYDPNLSPGQLEQAEIVVKLAKEADIQTEEIRDSDNNLWGTITTININGHSNTTFNILGPANMGDISTDSADPDVQDINDVIGSVRNSLLDKTRGDGSSGSFSQLGIDYAVPLDWFNHLKSSIFTLTQKYTKHYETSWTRLRHKMRHIATLPGRIYYEKEMAVIISIDQSGSMTDQDLEKVNYVVSALAKKSVFTEILLHDTTVAAREKFKGKDFPGIRKFITTRVACGGTSHAEVFQIVNEIKDQNKNMKLIYLSFSDNYSDIEHQYNDELFRDIPSYWIMTTGGKPVNVPGMQISLESGLLQN